MAIPTKYRDDIQACCERQLVLTVAINDRCVGEYGCLWLYPLPEWEKVEITISGLSTLNKMAANLRRFLIGNATECEMDAQGRILLPEKLRQFASMNKKIILLGQLNKFEIWNADVWATKETAWMNSTDMEGMDEIKHISF